MEKVRNAKKRKIQEEQQRNATAKDCKQTNAKVEKCQQINAKAKTCKK